METGESELCMPLSWCDRHITWGYKTLSVNIYDVPPPKEFIDLLSGQAMGETVVVEDLSFLTCRSRQARDGSLSLTLLRLGWAISLNPGKPWKP